MELKKLIINDIKSKGQEVKVRNMLIKEIIFYSFIVKTFDYELPKIEEVYVKQKIEKYRIQLNEVIKILKDDIYSRRAVIQFDMKDKLPECIESLQFLIRNNNLYCFVNQRSLDVENKLYTDIEIAKEFCNEIEKQLNVKLSYIKFMVNSCHYYLK
ncbi:hypothetical protein CL617_00675 [archaeon]|nr:hypothetical protein [archaeon]|tara:strand:- start:1577 stop:2044 length:468 start_codon:yes stop_codon:yes gene_type:complete